MFRVPGPHPYLDSHIIEMKSFIWVSTELYSELISVERNTTTLNRRISGKLRDWHIWIFLRHLN